MRQPVGLLFNKYDWYSVEENQKRQLSEEVLSIDGDRLLNSSVEDLCDYFVEKYTINVPVLRISDAVADQQEVKVDVSNDYNRAIDRHRPCFIQGTAIEVVIPFEGDAVLFEVRPTRYTLSPPRSLVKNQSLVFQTEGANLTSENVIAGFNRSIKDIEEYLDWLRQDAQKINSQIREMARNMIDARRQKLLADRNLIGSLGFKIKERGDKSRTYAAPEVRRKIVPQIPLGGTNSFVPEPILTEGDYDHILDTIQNMAEVMERSPSAFVSMDEEAIRFHILVQLNGQFEGQATGETFNYRGKTDILVRVEGKNIFIGECKFWSGPKKLTETIDQLLGYSSWRDTKTAVIVFNRNKDFSGVLTKIQETVKTHPSCKRELDNMTETMFRYVFGHKEDQSREMYLTVLAFNVPS